MEESEQDHARVKLPVSSQVSTVLNGVGNGMMIGTLPFIVAELYNNIQGKKVSPAASKGMLFTLAGSCVLGAAYGFYETLQNKKYDQILNNELDSLHEAQANQKTMMKSWQEKHAAKETHAVHHADSEHRR